MLTPGAFSASDIQDCGLLDSSLGQTTTSFDFVQSPAACATTQPVACRRPPVADVSALTDEEKTAVTQFMEPLSTIYTASGTVRAAVSIAGLVSDGRAAQAAALVAAESPVSHCGALSQKSRSWRSRCTTHSWTRRAHRPRAPCWVSAGKHRSRARTEAPEPRRDHTRALSCARPQAARLLTAHGLISPAPPGGTLVEPSSFALRSATVTVTTNAILATPFQLFPQSTVGYWIGEWQLLRGAVGLPSREGRPGLKSAHVCHARTQECS
jgi:hypothetical protein